jgi:hypothetical protein
MTLCLTQDRQYKVQIDQIKGKAGLKIFHPRRCVPLEKSKLDFRIHPPN